MDWKVRRQHVAWQSFRLLTVAYSWSAIVCGAVLRGLEGSAVTVKKCRRHYGHVLSHDYDPLKDKHFNKTKRHLWLDHFTGKQKLSGFMHWEMGKVCSPLGT